MADRPILFSAPMVRALLAGTKTQTRRIAGVPTIEPQGDLERWHVHGRHGGEVDVHFDDIGLIAAAYLPIQPGDRLWVRETWRSTGDGGRVDDWPPSRMQPHEVWYEADGVASADQCVGRVRVSIHMPRWASRLTLHVTDVRVQRLQEISEADALAEGADIAGDVERLGAPLDGIMVKTADAHIFAAPRTWYRELWDSINGRGAWDANPWVAAYTFTVERANIDQARAG